MGTYRFSSWRNVVNQTKKKIKLNKVREIIASRLRDDLRQPTLLRSAIQQGKKERNQVFQYLLKE